VVPMAIRSHAIIRGSRRPQLKRKPANAPGQLRFDSELAGHDQSEMVAK
jgi:hypothetical protein